MTLLVAAAVILISSSISQSEDQKITVHNPRVFVAGCLLGATALTIYLYLLTYQL